MMNALNPADTLEKIASIVRDILQCGPVAIDRKTRAMDVRGWDSLSQTMIIVALEESFAIEIPIERSMTLANVGELTDLVIEIASNKS